MASAHVFETATGPGGCGILTTVTVGPGAVREMVSGPLWQRFLPAKWTAAT